MKKVQVLQVSSLYAYTTNGRTAQDVPPAEYEARISRSLRNLNGESLFAYSLWRQPEGVDWGQKLPANWPYEFMQSAGAASGMPVEIRRLEDGEPQQYTIGRGGSRSTTQDQVVVFGSSRHELTVSADELFTAEEALPLYLSYYRTGNVPEGYSLRLLDLTYPKPEKG